MAIESSNKRIVIPSKVTSRFGRRNAPLTKAGFGSSNHRGTDLRFKKGTQLYSPFSGEVIFSGKKGGFGNLVEIKNDATGQVLRFAHLDSVANKAGDKIQPGQLLGLTGSTGKATGPSLHFEVIENGQNIDPEQYFRNNELFIRGVKVPVVTSGKKLNISSLTQPQQPPTIGQVSPTPLPQRTLGGANIGGLQIKAPELQVQTAVETTKRQELIRNDIEKQENLQLLGALTSFGKPLEKLSIEEVLDASQGDAAIAKKVIDLRNSFKKDNKQQTMDFVVSTIGDLFDLADSIPVAKGLQGRAVALKNKALGAAGLLPELAVYNNILGLVGPMIAKSFGESGRLSDQDIQRAIGGLEAIATGTFKERNLQKNILINALERSVGRKLPDLRPKGQQKGLKGMSNEELFKALGQ